MKGGFKQQNENTKGKPKGRETFSCMGNHNRNEKNHLQTYLCKHYSINCNNWIDSFCDIQIIKTFKNIIEQEAHMKEQRSRTNDEKELELNLLIQSSKIENLLKTIHRTSGRKKIQSLIKETKQEIMNLHTLFTDYEKKLSK